jgi:Tol biopolymer transport system component
MRARRLLWGAPALLVLPAAAWLYLQSRPDPLPQGVQGLLVYVSDRSGMDALYARRLPDGEERRLTFLNEPVREPAISPNGRWVAFSMRGRIGLVAVASGQVRILTVGVDWKDAAPCWRSDGRALLVSARRPQGMADVHLLAFDPAAGEATRTPLTDTAGLDETDPIFGPGDGSVIFVREDALFRLDLAEGRARRLSSGFRRLYAPRLLPSGRLLCLWVEGKQFGIDVMDADGKNRETLEQGTVRYRSVAPSADGRYLAASYALDLAFHPLEALKRRPTEEVHLLDAHGRRLAVLARSWRFSHHSPAWSP